MMPHFAVVTGLVARAAIISAQTATELRLPPVLLLGGAGVGKTFFGRRLAEAILGERAERSDFALIPLNTTDAFRIRGQNTGWRGARMGRIAEILLASSTSAFALIDEVDKASATGSSFERPLDVWLSLLEPENARHFRDDYLEIEMRADHILWFATANDLTSIPVPIVDRFIVVEIEQPSRAQLTTIIASLYARCREAYRGYLPEHLADDVVGELARHNLRRTNQILQLAVGYAVADGRMRLMAEDVRMARTLADYTSFPSFKRRVGFVPGGGMQAGD